MAQKNDQQQVVSTTSSAIGSELKLCFASQYLWRKQSGVLLGLGQEGRCWNQVQSESVSNVKVCNSTAVVCCIGGNGLLHAAFWLPTSKPVHIRVVMCIFSLSRPISVLLNDNSTVMPPQMHRQPFLSIIGMHCFRCNNRALNKGPGVSHGFETVMLVC